MRVPLTKLVHYSRLEIFHDQKLELGECRNCPARREWSKYLFPIITLLIFIPFSTLEHHYYFAFNNWLRLRSKVHLGHSREKSWHPD